MSLQQPGFQASRVAVAEKRLSSNIVFIDSQVNDYPVLAKGVVPGASLFILDATTDGVDQITRILQQHMGVAAVHIVSHGSQSSLQLGSGELNLDNIESYARQLRSWSQALTENADILLYGCNVASGAAGVAFVQQLNLLTKANIAASDTLTGSAAKGGNWHLEVTSGTISAGNAFAEEARALYREVLTNYPVGNSPKSAAIGDVNGDGNNDIVTANENSNNVSVLLANGSGGFDAATTLELGGETRPISVAIGDVNSDGNNDIVTANFGSNSVSVLLANGTGGFNPATTLGLGGGESPYFVAIGDVNSDGRNDIVTANSNTDNVSVLLANASGGFDAATNLGVNEGSAPSSVAIGDVNSDGNNDIVTGNFDNSVSVLLANGSGGFNAATTLGLGGGTSPRSIAIGDINGDSKNDIVTANEDTNNVSVLLANGSGGFNAATTLDLGGGTRPYSAAIGDINGDGINDIVTANLGTSDISLLLANGIGGFNPAALLNTGSGSRPISVAIGDINGNGRNDIVTANVSSNNISVLTPPFVSNPISNQKVISGNQFNYSVPANTFSDPDSEPLTYTATLADGTALPAWLTFSNGTFSGTPSNSDGATLSIKVTATDPNNISAQATFNLAVATLINGSTGNDTLIGDNNDNIINGGAGNDVIAGLGGADDIDGGAGINAANYTSSPTGVNVNLTTGTASGGDATGDTLVNIQNIRGSNYSDILTGNDGNNYLYGYSGDDTLNGGGGTDYLYGGVGNDTLSGGIGTDYLYGEAGNDTINGDDGNDFLTGGSGADVINGGLGTDTAIYTTSTAGVVINLATSTVSGGDATGDTITSIENLQGSNYSDTLTGDNNNNNLNGFAGDDILNGGDGNDNLNGGDGTDTLSGSTGNDYLYGEAGVDTLSGGDGSDYLYGGSGADVLDGGLGTDTAMYTTSTAGVIVNLTTGIGTGGDAAGDTLSNIENLYASSYSDTITGNNSINIIYGLGGDDTLTAGGGNDYLYGGDGIDTLIGVNAANFGVGEKDILTGGAGADVFVLGTSLGVFYNDANNTNAGLTEYATIADFDVTSDHVQLTNGLSYYRGAAPAGTGGGTGIFIDNDGITGLTTKDELIGVLKGVSLTAGQITSSTAGFSFV